MSHLTSPMEVKFRRFCIQLTFCI